MTQDSNSVSSYFLWGLDHPSAAARTQPTHLSVAFVPLFLEYPRNMAVISDGSLLGTSHVPKCKVKPQARNATGEAY